MQRLQGTQLCFSCAHGRPTIAPMADLSAVRRLASARRTSAASSFAAGASDFKTARIKTTAALCDKMNRILES